MTHLAPRGTATRAAEVRQRCGDCQGLPAPELMVARSRARRMERHLQYLRELRPGGWDPHIELIGDEHISQALASGTGCILWVAPMMFAFLVAKKGLSAAGYCLTHLSHIEHAVSHDTRLAHSLSAFRIIPEDRYLAQRVLMTDGSELRSARQLYERLQGNALVSITAETEWGARQVTAPFLGRTMRLPTGAPSLALASGAALLPVFAVKQAPDRFEVLIEPALVPSSSPSRHEAVDELVRRYVARIEHHVMRHPDQYANWW
jgi:predicted LPLAT superfamily acyltransferase